MPENKPTKAILCFTYVSRIIYQGFKIAVAPVSKHWETYECYRSTFKEQLQAMTLTSMSVLCSNYIHCFFLKLQFRNLFINSYSYHSIHHVWEKLDKLTKRKHCFGKTEFCKIVLWEKKKRLVKTPREQNLTSWRIMKIILRQSWWVAAGEFNWYLLTDLESLKCSLISLFSIVFYIVPYKFCSVSITCLEARKTNSAP